ncbi:hypothetical protein LWI28_023694 [Acer negundo]|uniref:CCHC-type domain-containing protein n=1 Tax=Acer negundo TaxID=4023 RepID=A0AAD5IVR6_ACENE|nr:hypothetical protein LWI28_023694 [Acer negundo]
MNQDLIRFERFDGENFTHWQEKVKFFLTTFHLAHILEDDLETIPKEKADDSKELKEKRKKRKEEDYLCRGRILNALGRTVYNAYRNISTAKELWTALDNKYRIKEAIAGVNLDESFLVEVIISKLPSSWNGYKKKLKYDEKKHTLESIQRHLRIEEDSRICKSKDEQTDFMSKANVVEDGKSNNYLGPKNTNKFKNHHQNKKKNQKKIKGNCYYCKKPGYMTQDCHKRKKYIQNQGNQVNMTEDKYVATVCDVNSVDIESGWWLDTVATIHICKDRSLFKTYEKTEDGNETNYLQIQIQEPRRNLGFPLQPPQFPIPFAPPQAPLVRNNYEILQQQLQPRFIEPNGNMRPRAPVAQPNQHVAQVPDVIDLDFDDKGTAVWTTVGKEGQRLHGEGTAMAWCFSLVLHHYGYRWLA